MSYFIYLFLIWNFKILISTGNLCEEGQVGKESADGVSNYRPIWCIYLTSPSYLKKFT